MEDRWLLATFTVLNTEDSGAGSLRAAIEAANANTADSEHQIVFHNGVFGGALSPLPSPPDICR